MCRIIQNTCITYVQPESYERNRRACAKSPLSPSTCGSLKSLTCEAVGGSLRPQLSSTTTLCKIRNNHAANDPTQRPQPQPIPQILVYWKTQKKLFSAATFSPPLTSRVFQTLCMSVWVFSFLVINQVSNMGNGYEIAVSTPYFQKWYFIPSELYTHLPSPFPPPPLTLIL